MSLLACGVWQSQYPLGRRASASVAMLTDTLRQLPNLSIKVRTLLGRGPPQIHPLASKEGINKKKAGSVIEAFATLGVDRVADANDGTACGDGTR